MCFSLSLSPCFAVFVSILSIKAPERRANVYWDCTAATLILPTQPIQKIYPILAQTHALVSCLCVLCEYEWLWKKKIEFHICREHWGWCCFSVLLKSRNRKIVPFVSYSPIPTFNFMLFFKWIRCERCSTICDSENSGNVYLIDCKK